MKAEEKIKIEEESPGLNQTFNKKNDQPSLSSQAMKSFRELVPQITPKRNHGPR